MFPKEGRGKDYQEIADKNTATSIQSLLLSEYLEKGCQLQKEAKGDFMLGYDSMEGPTILERELYGINLSKINNVDLLIHKYTKVFEELILTAPLPYVMSIINETFDGYFELYLEECELPQFKSRFRTSEFYLVDIFQDDIYQYQFFTPLVSYKRKASYIFPDKENGFNYSIGSLGRFLAENFIIMKVIDFSNEERNFFHSGVYDFRAEIREWFKSKLSKELFERVERNNLSDCLMDGQLFDYLHSLQSSERAEFYQNLYFYNQRYPKFAQITEQYEEVHCAKPRFIYGSHFFKIYKEVLATESEKIRFITEVEKEDAKYASINQKKKYLPQHVIYAMQNSELNNVFGYVEFDERYDKDKTEVFATEVNYFVKKYFPSLDLSSYSIRIRRLGKHKVNGFYSPGYKCLCLDIKTSRSFVRTFGSLIDHYYNFLSYQRDFVPVINAYTRAFNKLMITSNRFKSLKYSKSKFNMNYYLSPKQIFASSFELYVSKKLKLNNMLISAFFNEFYCEFDMEYLDELETYFDTLFNKMNNNIL